MGKILFYGLSSKVGAVCQSGANAKMLKNIQNELLMAASQRGVGCLCANQIGSLVKLVIILKKQYVIAGKWLGYSKIKNYHYKSYYRPQIIDFSLQKQQEWEQCASYPGLKFLIERSKLIKLKYQDAKKKTFESEQSGIISRMIQHQCDHMIGIDLLKKCSKIAIVNKKLEQQYQDQVDSLLQNYHQDIKIDKQNFYDSLNFRKLKQLLTYSIIDSFN